MSQTIKFVIALAVILALVVLILILKKCHETTKHDKELIRQYNAEMDKIRTERLEEAKRKLREAEKKKTYYTTYNERDNMTATEKYKLAHYAKRRFPKKK